MNNHEEKTNRSSLHEERDDTVNEAEDDDSLDIIDLNKSPEENDVGDRKQPLANNSRLDQRAALPHDNALDSAPSSTNAENSTQPQSTSENTITTATTTTATTINTPTITTATTATPTTTLLDNQPQEITSDTTVKLTTPVPASAPIPADTRTPVVQATVAASASISVQTSVPASDIAKVANNNNPPTNTVVSGKPTQQQLQQQPPSRIPYEQLQPSPLANAAPPSPSLIQQKKRAREEFFNAVESMKEQVLAIYHYGDKKIVKQMRAEFGKLETLFMNIKSIELGSNDVGVRLLHSEQKRGLPNSAPKATPMTTTTTTKVTSKVIPASGSVGRPIASAGSPVTPVAPNGNTSNVPRYSSPHAGQTVVVPVAVSPQHPQYPYHPHHQQSHPQHPQHPVEHPPYGIYYAPYYGPPHPQGVSYAPSGKQTPPTPGGAPPSYGYYHPYPLSYAGHPPPQYVVPPSQQPQPLRPATTATTTTTTTTVVPATGAVPTPPPKPGTPTIASGPVQGQATPVRTAVVNVLKSSTPTPPATAVPVAKTPQQKQQQPGAAKPIHPAPRGPSPYSQQHPPTTPTASTTPTSRPAPPMYTTIAALPPSAYGPAGGSYGMHYSSGPSSGSPQQHPTTVGYPPTMVPHAVPLGPGGYPPAKTTPPSSYPYPYSYGPPPQGYHPPPGYPPQYAPQPQPLHPHHPSTPIAPALAPAPAPAPAPSSNTNTTTTATTTTTTTRPSSGFVAVGHLSSS